MKLFNLFVCLFVGWLASCLMLCWKILSSSGHWDRRWILFRMTKSQKTRWGSEKCIRNLCQ